MARCWAILRPQTRRRKVYLVEAVTDTANKTAYVVSLRIENSAGNTKGIPHLAMRNTSARPSTTSETGDWDALNANIAEQGTNVNPGCHGDKSKKASAFTWRMLDDFSSPYPVTAEPGVILDALSLNITEQGNDVNQAAQWR